MGIARYCIVCVALYISTHVFLCAEPSAFELQGGATKKDMRELKDVADFTRSVISDFQTKIVNLEQAIEGLKTVYEGMSATSRQDTLLLKSQVDKITNLQDIVESLQTSQKSRSENVAKLEAQVEANTNSIVQINQKIDKLSEAFLQANEEILKQIEVLSQQALTLQNSIQAIQNQPIVNAIKENNASDSMQKYKFSQNSNADNLKEAKRLLKQKRLNDAKAYFEYLVGNNYAVAESSYYLGEIYYAHKEYNEALPYYKTSASLDSKASYMPILLWHTAWSFKYLNDAENYKKFLQTLVTLFPESEQGRKAKDILNK
ncbi:tol-pal system YbgF family protein [Helicobacter sp. MIT 14-3879]|uniref:tetratricopeptide repeat protein n=1 Tax=Helicobacter sp. MIT 14-3879 TaxID=2040649 RepID=UPI000E1F70CB|nr:tetratricopeptide repeat protein [Helicobacter sp. MIT 14-3879]RDU61558.1 hypothetical protein CQA44_08550 [Helicobacter sp. MIT 14-3879]